MNKPKRNVRTSNIVGLAQWKASKQKLTPSRNPFEALLRALVAAFIIAGSITIAQRCEDKAARERHVKYVQCLQSGKTPMLCSFNVAFK